MTAANPVTLPLKDYAARHVRLGVDGKVATITLDRPDKKNPLTFDSYAELADLFRAAAKEKTVKAFVICGAGGNFCSGGDVFEIIEPLVKMATADLLAFTRMTGEVIKAMRACPQPIVAAIDGVCTGAGAMIACASDLRYATVYVSVLGSLKKRTATLRGLEAAHGLLQSKLARELRLKRTPQLTFEYDPTVEHGVRMSQLIDELAPGDDADVE